MKIKIILIFASIFFSTIISAQDAFNKTDASGKKQGFWIKLDDNKKKIYEGNFVDNIPVGKFIYYYDNGQPWSISIFSQKGKVARSQMFDAGGKLTGEGKYVNEKKDSVWKFYNQEGKLLSDEIYVNGIKTGVARVYYPNGQIAEEKNWKNGVLQGVCKKYFESGTLKYLGQYVNGKVEGKVQYFHPSGKVDAEGVYVNDVKNGDWKYYKEDGRLDRIDKYIDGKLQGVDKNVISKEQQNKEKQQFEQFEIKDPYQEGYNPH